MELFFLYGFDNEESHQLSTQAVLWEIRKEWLVKAEHFVSH